MHMKARLVCDTACAGDCRTSGGQCGIAKPDHSCTGATEQQQLAAAAATQPIFVARSPKVQCFLTQLHRSESRQSVLLPCQLVAVQPAVHSLMDIPFVLFLGSYTQVVLSLYTLYLCSGLLPQEAPVIIAERRRFFVSFHYTFTRIREI